MPTEKWAAGAVSLQKVLGTELNALADAAYSDKTGAGDGTVLDNTSAADRFAVAQLNVTYAVAPTAETVVDLYMVVSLDGTSYPDGGLTVTPAGVYRVGSFQLQAVTTAQQVETAPFELRGPYKHKFIARNRAGTAMPATGSTIKVSTFNRVVT